MSSLDQALLLLGDTLAGRPEVKRFRKAREQVARDPEASKALAAFLTACYTHARTSGGGGNGHDEGERLGAQRHALCRNPAVKAYLDAHDAVQQLLLGIQQQVHDTLLGHT